MAEMKLYIIGIDGLELEVINTYINELPNFKKIKAEGILKNIQTVFPADSVPAWNTIFTGLNPGEHGIIRGKDYVESIESYEDHLDFKLAGNTFWDKLSLKGKKCLIINPFLAYPSWTINGIMESGPAFVTGSPSFSPSDIEVKYPEVLGGYQAIRDIGYIKQDMTVALDDTIKLYDEFKYQLNKSQFDMGFVTFTTLDRVQHYTWRNYDENDPLYEYDEYLSNCILHMLKVFDRILGDVIERLNTNDKLLVISDHGFGRRPYNLVNLNEYLRQHGLLQLRSSNMVATKSIQVIKKKLVSFLSKFKKLDLVIRLLKYFPAVKKMKKSDYLIDKDKSLAYVDESFNGKKPYCGINFGNDVRNGSVNGKEEAFQKVSEILNSGAIPKPKWIKKNHDLYPGVNSNRFPDVCFEFPSEYGVEYELFSSIYSKSVTHYKISGGHLGSGTFGYYSPSKENIRNISEISEFSSLVDEIMQ